MATELVGRFLAESRRPLPAIALTADSCVQSALANDFGFDSAFARQVRALGEKDDLLVAISTSGGSENVLRAVSAAKELGMRTLALLGRDGGRTRGMADVEIIVPSQDTPRIQEVHILVIHTLCGYVDEALAG
jgi:D-sedoheptulose 7-phosphate isomerase